MYEAQSLYMRSCNLFLLGTRHGYSNFGYLVLGHVIEKLTGIPYPIYIHDVINKVGDIDLLVYEGDELHRLHPNEVMYFSYTVTGSCNRESIIESNKHTF